ncbi:hypothetical protein [Microvirga roseola]
MTKTPDERLETEGPEYAEFRRYRAFVARHREAEGRRRRAAFRRRVLVRAALLALLPAGILAAAWGVGRLNERARPVHPSAWTFAVKARHEAARPRGGPRASLPGRARLLAASRPGRRRDRLRDHPLRHDRPGAPHAPRRAVRKRQGRG